MTRFLLLWCFILIGCSNGEGSRCAKPQDCPKGQTCGKDYRCFDPIKKAEHATSNKTGRDSPLPTTTTPAVDPTLPETLGRRQVLSTVRRNMAKIRDCRRLEPGISSKVIVEFVINGSGRVADATAKGQYAHTQIGECVAQKVTTIRFPKFSGKPITISSFPFSL